jgi:hypothetical protein
MKTQNTKLTSKKITNKPENNLIDILELFKQSSESIFEVQSKQLQNILSLMDISSKSLVNSEPLFKLVNNQLLSVFNSNVGFWTTLNNIYINASIKKKNDYEIANIESTVTDNIKEDFIIFNN